MSMGRSPNYPAINLSEAISLTQKLYAQEKRTPVEPAVAVTAWGYQGLNGASTRMLSAVRQYGLISQDGKNYKISDLAMKILHPADDSEHNEALNDAALYPGILLEINNQWPDASDVSLKSRLVREKSYNEAAADRIIKTYRENVEFLKDRLLGAQGSIAHEDLSENASEEPPTPASSKAVPHTEPGLIFSFPLAADVQAEVKFTGGSFDAKYFKRLIDHLELAYKHFREIKEAATTEE